jgi:hypothetical protein
VVGVVCVCAFLLLLQPRGTRRSTTARGCGEVVSHVDATASPPNLALYFFLTYDVLLRGWPVDLLFGTLASNPTLSVFVLIDDENMTPAMRVSPASVASELARACRCRGKDLVFLHTSALNSSRAKTMRPLHDGMFPKEQTAGRIRMFGRFCFQADLARMLGHRRVVTLDSDIVLLEDVAYLAGAYPQDVVSPADWTSQFVLWSQHGLDAFCDAIHSHFGWNQSTFMARSRMYPLDDVWNDMYFLRWWLDDPSSRHLSRHLFLPGFHLASPYNASTAGPDLKWLAAADFNFFGRGCGTASEVVCLANYTGSSQLQPRTFCSTGDALGGLHFQGDVCKSRAKAFIRGLYRQQGQGDWTYNRCMPQL